MRSTASRMVRWTAWGALSLSSCMAAATPISVDDPYYYSVISSTNTLGITPGQRLSFGAQTVVPNGSAGTTATAAQGGVTLDLPWFGTTTFNNEFSRSMTPDNTLLGPWTLTFRNGNDATVVTTPSIKSTTPLPFVRSVRLSGSTVTWTLPNTPGIDAVRINVRDHGNNLSGNGSDIVFNRTYAGTRTSITLPSVLNNGLPLNGSHYYTVEISLIDTATNTASFTQSQIERRSRLYVDFTPPATTSSVYLPVVAPGGSGAPPVYHFDIASVAAGTVYNIDPPAVAGYDYAIGAGDPNFASVLLPAGIGDGVYQVTTPGGGSFQVQGGSTFSFGAAGVASFGVRGIEADAGLSQDNATAFVTGVTFIRAGQFTGTMMPVPEPGAAALMLVGLLSLAGLSRRVTRG
jgi:hypothetical protein